MSRRVPEFALVTGLLLGLSTLASGVVLTGDVVTTSLLSALVSYPFVAYAVVRDVDEQRSSARQTRSGDSDPTTVMPPRAVLALGALFGVSLLAVSVLADPSPSNALFGLFVGLLVALPPVAYAVYFGADANPLSPRETVFAGVGVGVALLVAGLLAGSASYGAADALLVGLSAAVYGAARGVRFGARTKRAAVAVGVVLAVAVVAVGVGRGEPLGEWIVAAMALTLAPSVYYALTSTRGVGSGRRRTRR